MRVLAADDNQEMSRAIEVCLRRWGYEPVMARDGHEAWRMLKQDDAPRIVILDWDMPGLSGPEVCRMLRSTPHGEGTYVLILTAKDETDDLVAALESGADDFVSKPFHPRELQLRLAKGVREVSSRTSVSKMAAQESVPVPSGAVPPSGTIVGEKYRLERKLAAGGMGSVWLGVHLSLGINVAIKFMAPKLAETADYASFEREARSAAQLRNEHIVRVFDHGISREGLPYLVMEYLAGESLLERIQRTGPLHSEEVVVVIGQAARALGEAHERGIVHRDVKPENILLIEDASRPHGFCVKLIDFGLAQNEGLNHQRDAVAGTPAYMAPEYLRGEVNASPRVDLWALAACAFVAMTGALPFDGSSFATIYERVTTKPLPVPSRINPAVPLDFDVWFATACARDPAKRFPNAGELAAALADACGVSRASLLPRSQPGRGPAVVSFAPTEPHSGSLKGLPTATQDEVSSKVS